MGVVVRDKAKGGEKVWVASGRAELGLSTFEVWQGVRCNDAEGVQVEDRMDQMAWWLSFSLEGDR